MLLKQKIYEHYKQVVGAKITALQKTLAGLKESGSNETKSTAGDKHETALAMLQIEQENTRAQLQETLKQYAVLEKIDPSLCAGMVLNGSLVKTNKGYFYISTALGKVLVDGISVIAISPQSPLGQSLMGLKTGAKAVVNDTVYVIESIE